MSMSYGYDESNRLAQEEKAAKKRQEELEDTKPRKAYRYEENFSEDLLGLKGKNKVQKFKFHWGAFFVMILSIGAALMVGYFIPGPFDEFLATVAISSIYGFLNAHDFKIKNIFKK